MPKLKIRLSSCGNPDMGQDPRNPKYGCEPNRWQPVKDLKEARDAYQTYVRNNQLGSGNIGPKCGQIVNEVGKVQAYVTYNGRVWEKAPDYKGPMPQEILV
jgi:hypothetical protein